MKRYMKYAYLAVFAAFYVFLLMQFGNVFIYYDDYGYLSLSYGTNIDVAGAEYSLSELLAFMRGHYFNSNGRLLYMFLYCFVHMLGGIRGVQVFMATAVLAVALLLFFIARRMLAGRLEAAKTEESGAEETDGEFQGQLGPIGQAALAAFVCLLYGTLGIMVQRMGTYWYAASFIYVVPAVTFLVFAVYFYRTVFLSSGEKPGIFRMCLCAVLGFLAAWSQEQWFVTTVSFVVICLGVKLWRDRRLEIYEILTFLVCAAGGLIIILSPAVSARMNSAGNAEFASLSLFGKLGRNIPLLMNLFFSGENIRYLMFFFPMMIFMGCMAAAKDRKLLPLHLGFSAVSAAVFAAVVLKQKLHVFAPGAYSALTANLLLLYIAFCFAEVILFYRAEKQPFGSIVFTAAVLSVGSAAIVPEVPLRIFYPFLYLSWLLFSYMYGRILLTEAKKIPVSAACTLAFLAMVSIPNLKSIYTGYKLNYQVLMYDDAVFKASAEAIRQGADIETIEVYELPDLLCKNEVVYDENFSFMIAWMRQYYDLPEYVEFEYRPLGNMEDLRQ
ncbi:MAG: hypothetical protein KH353_03715 [Clostridium sp.]|nr:hypothetical protein [Clostridium sp.]